MKLTAITALLLSALLVSPAKGADLEAARKQLATGQYSECLRACESAAQARAENDEWLLLRAKTLLTVGRYDDARNVIERGLMRYYDNARVRLLAFEIYRAQGALYEAAAVLQRSRRAGR